jgi:hypothetical protein
VLCHEAFLQCDKNSVVHLRPKGIEKVVESQLALPFFPPSRIFHFSSIEGIPRPGIQEEQ